MRMLATLLVLLALGGPVRAAGIDPAAFAWTPHPGAQVPLDIGLRDEAGRAVTLRQVIGDTPVILDLGYFHCPALCGVARADLLDVLDNSGLAAGRDYRLALVSIDPAESPGDAAQARQADLAQFPSEGGARHYLTGAQPAIDALAAAVGFRDRYDATVRQFLHPTGIVVLTRAGVVSGYLLGVGYQPGDLRAAVLRAGDGGIARAALPVLLLCFHFDSTTGRYTLAIEKLLRLMGALTVVTLGATLFVLHRQKPRVS